MSNNKFADCNEEKCKKREECSNKGKVEAPLNYGKKREGLVYPKNKVCYNGKLIPLKTFLRHPSFLVILNIIME